MDTSVEPPVVKRLCTQEIVDLALRLVALALRQHCCRMGPIIEAGAENPDAVDVGGQPHPARPKIKLQLVPPKPKELLRTRFTGPRRLSLM